MNRSLTVLFTATFVLLRCVAAEGAESKSSNSASVQTQQWIAFPDARLELRGLPWFEENSPELWRLPKSAKSHVPAAVWARAVAPDGGRIRFRSSTSQLALRVDVAQPARRGTFFDVTVDQAWAGSASATAKGAGELTLFSGRGRETKDITIYLPNTSQVRVLAVGIDADATLGPASDFAVKAPLVCYGSSVLQGTGADHPAKTYVAAVARRLNVDFVNLGFGGAGKAEPAVVALVNQLEVCGYVFDLGKSYGAQDERAFVAMLAAVRAAHPRVPILVITPIYSTFEPEQPAYLEKSIRLRDMMRRAAMARHAAGDTLTSVVEGLDLFGPDDKALFRDPQHPNDEGNERMAERLAPTLAKLIGGE